jgi:hypothetical protein
MGCSLRVVCIDGTYLAINADACSDRLDVKIENGIIAHLNHFGSMRRYPSKNYQVNYDFIEDLIKEKYSTWYYLLGKQQIENKELTDLFILENGKQIPICTLDKDGNILDDFMDIKRQLNLKEFF